MSNSVLFLSSLLLGSIHLVAMLWFAPANVWLCTTMLAGIATSMWNHGVTSYVAKIADRVMMLIGFMVDWYLIWCIKDPTRFRLCLSTLVAAAVLYLLAKWFIKWKHRAPQVTHPMLPVSTSKEAMHPSSSVSVYRYYLLDLPHLFAHISLTMTHLVLLEAYAVYYM